MRSKTRSSAASRCCGLEPPPCAMSGAPAALAADRLRHLAHDLAGVEPADEVGRHHRHERDLVALDARQHDDARAQLVAQLVGTSRSALASATSARVASTRTPPTSRASAARSRPPPDASLRRSLSISLSRSRSSACSLATRVGDLEAARAQQPRRSRRARPPAGARSRARPAPVTASMRRTPCAMPVSSVILKKRDVAGARDVGAAAELLRLAHRHHAHAVAVLLAEERDRARLLGLGDRQHRGVGGGVARGSRSLTSSSTSPLLGVRQRRAVREVEAQPVGRDQRALLRDVCRPARCAAPSAAGASPSGCADRVAPLGVDRQLDRVADAQLARSRPRPGGPTASPPAACSRAPSCAPSRRRRARRCRRSGRPARRRTASRR